MRCTYKLQLVKVEREADCSHLGLGEVLGNRPREVDREKNRHKVTEKEMWLGGKA